MSAKKLIVAPPSMASGGPENIDVLTEFLDDALNSFENVHFGRKFLSTFQDKQLQLDGVRLQLSRWGLVGCIPTESQRNDTSTLPTTSRPLPEQALKKILDLFAKEERIYLNSEKPTKPDFLSVQEHMDGTGRSLHGKIETLVVKRRNSLDIRSRRKWAFLDEEQYRNFLGKIVHYTNTLLNMIPPAQRALIREICEREVSELGGKLQLSMMWGIAASQDKDLEDAITKALRSEKPSGNSQNNTTYNYNTKFSNDQVVTDIYNGHKNYTFNESTIN